MIVAALLAGCLDRLHEAPYVLAVDLGEARSLAFDGDGRLLVATPAGVRAVDREGRVTPLDAHPARAVTASRAGIFTVDGARLRGPGIDLPAPGALDVAAAWDDRLWVLYPDRLVAVDPRDAREEPRVAGLVDARAVALAPPPRMVVVTATAVLAVDAAGAATPLADGLVDARAAAVDAEGGVYVAAGSPPEVWRYGSGPPARVARFLEDPRDLHLTVRPPFPPDRLWIAAGAGRVDYLPLR